MVNDSHKENEYDICKIKQEEMTQNMVMKRRNKHMATIFDDYY